MARATSKPVSYHALNSDERLRHWVAAVERNDWKLVQRLTLSAPRGGGEHIDPGFLRRVDGLRRLTYRVLTVLLSATSWAETPYGHNGRGMAPWSPLGVEPSEIEDPARFSRRFAALRRQVQGRCEAAAELWTAFDRFCADVAGCPAASVVSVVSAGERDRVGGPVTRAQAGGLDQLKIEEALQAMYSFWRKFIDSREETVLVLD